MSLANPLHHEPATGDEVEFALCEQLPSARLEGTTLQPQFVARRYPQRLDWVQQLYPKLEGSASDKVGPE